MSDSYLLAYHELLEKFNNTPKKISRTTFLELCRYPRHRFEEICSRILCFFLDPKNEHNFGGLFLSSIFSLCNKTDIDVENQAVKIISEDNADGKRIDIIVHNDNFLLAIENKITADLYNPLVAYKKRIDSYNSEIKISVVLSLKPILDKSQIKLMCDTNFINITYSQLFDKISSNIGSRMLGNVDMYYVNLLTDFMNTINNLDTLGIEQSLVNFLYDNEVSIKNLKDAYEELKKKVLNKQKTKIAELFEKIKIKTQDESWWVWGGYDLGIRKKDKNETELGVEGWFIDKKDSPLSEYVIYLTAWSKENWNIFENTILKFMPNAEIEHQEFKSVILLERLKFNDDIDIINAYEKSYNLLNLIVDNNKQIEEK